MKQYMIAILGCCWLSAAPAQEAQEPAKGTQCPAGGSDSGKKEKKRPRVDSSKRAEAVRALCRRLGVGEGKVVADIGCGKGLDTMSFASVVGVSGRVYGEEISQAPLDALALEARDSKSVQIVPVLGSSKDPRLPDAAIDLIYMHRVFHHFTQPRSMLAHFMSDLKPGGHLVIVDGERGPQRKWPAMAGREKKHSFTGETTVVRLAREAGFHFQAEYDDLWPDRKLFVLVFRKPRS